ASRQRSAAETEYLFDLDRRRKLTTLRIVTGATHLLIEKAAQIRDSGSALPGGFEKGRRHGLGILRAIRVLLIQIVLQGLFLRLGSGFHTRKRFDDRFLHFRPTGGCRLRKGGR